MAYNGPQEQAQASVPYTTNNGNPNGINNVPRGARPAQGRPPRYTPPVLNDAGVVTNSDVNHFAMPTWSNFGYNGMGLPQGFNPMSTLNSMFGNQSGMFSGGNREGGQNESRIEQLLNQLIGMYQPRDRIYAAPGRGPQPGDEGGLGSTGAYDVPAPGPTPVPTTGVGDGSKPYWEGNVPPNINPPASGGAKPATMGGGPKPAGAPSAMSIEEIRRMLGFGAPVARDPLKG